MPCRKIGCSRSHLRPDEVFQTQPYLVPQGVLHRQLFLDYDTLPFGNGCSPSISQFGDFLYSHPEPLEIEDLVARYPSFKGESVSHQ